MIVLCDLDGTLCDCTHRQHFAIAKDWGGFHEYIPNDTVLGHTEEVLRMFIAADNKVFFLTGRPEETFPQTKEWLEEVALMDEGLDWAGIIMRPRGDYTPDYKLKLQQMMENMCRSETPLCQALQSEMDYDPFSDGDWETYLAANIEDAKQRVLILDDRDRVVESFRNEGWTCWQVQQGVW